MSRIFLHKTIHDFPTRKHHFEGSRRREKKKLENDKLCGFNAALAIISFLFFVGSSVWFVSNGATVAKLLEDRLKAF